MEIRKIAFKNFWLQGINFVNKQGVGKISEHEIGLMSYIYQQLAGMKGIKLYTSCPEITQYAPVLAFNVEGMQSEEAAQILGKKGIAVRAGLHCAPCAHIKYDTLHTGTIRLAPSIFTTMKEAQYVCRIIRNI
jgi:selenocysteine lyase/cysteine desulfurase